MKQILTTQIVPAGRRPAGLDARDRETELGSTCLDRSAPHQGAPRTQLSALPRLPVDADDHRMPDAIAAKRPASRTGSPGTVSHAGLRRSRSCTMLPGCVVGGGIAQPTGAAGVGATWEPCRVVSSWW